jgi:hypothetical protein
MHALLQGIEIGISLAVFAAAIMLSFTKPIGADSRAERDSDENSH